MENPKRSIRVPDEDWNAWQEQAAQADQEVSAWVRDKLNAIVTFGGSGTAPRDVLQSISEDPKAPQSSRVQAARALIDYHAVDGSNDPTVARFIAARDMLETLPEEDRLEYLRGIEPVTEALNT